MTRYVNLKLTRTEAEAVWAALDCEIVSRHEAAHNNNGERCDVPRGKGAIDDHVPAMERVLGRVKAAVKEVE